MHFGAAESVAPTVRTQADALKVPLLEGAQLELLIHCSTSGSVRRRRWRRRRMRCRWSSWRRLQSSQPHSFASTGATLIPDLRIHRAYRTLTFASSGDSGIRYPAQVFVGDTFTLFAGMADGTRSCGACNAFGPALLSMADAASRCCRASWGTTRRRCCCFSRRRSST